MKIRIVHIAVLIILSKTSLFSQTIFDKGTFCISTNPIKLIYGIANLELEYYIGPNVSFQLGSEYVIGHYIIKEDEHPDFVFRIGPRYHFFGNKDLDSNFNIFFGAFSGFTWSHDFENMRELNFGPEIGLKYKFEKPIFILAKAYLTSPYKNFKPIPGIECLVGYSSKF